MGNRLEYLVKKYAPELKRG